MKRSCLILVRYSSLSSPRLLRRFFHSSCCSSNVCLPALFYLRSSDSGHTLQHEAALSSRCHFSTRYSSNSVLSSSFVYRQHRFGRDFCTSDEPTQKLGSSDHNSQQAVTTSLLSNFFVFSLKFGVWILTSSHVMFAEVVHSFADIVNQTFLAYGLSSSRRPHDALRLYGHPREELFWSLETLAGIFCAGSVVTIVHGCHNLWTCLQPNNIQYAALLIGGALIIKGGSLVVATQSAKNNAAAEGMKLRDYIWLGHDPTSAAVMIEDGAAVIGLVIAGGSLVALHMTGNAMYDAIGCIVVGNLLGMVTIFIIQMNGFVFIGRAMDDKDMERVLRFLKNDPVVGSLYCCKSHVIGPGLYRFTAEIDFNEVVLMRNYINNIGRLKWFGQFIEAMDKDDDVVFNVVANYCKEGRAEVLTGIRREIDRLEKEIQELVPGIRRVTIEARNGSISCLNFVLKLESNSGEV